MVAWEWPKWAMAELGWLALWDGNNEIMGVQHFAQSGLWLSTAEQQCLAWPGLSETGLRVATFREWLASVCGGPRERERRRPRDESGNQRAGQRPPGQTIRGPLHYIYLNILQPIVCTVFLCNLLDPPSDVKQDSSSIQGQNRTILQEIPYQSLPWGAHYNKVYRTYLVESICCLFVVCSWTQSGLVTITWMVFRTCVCVVSLILFAICVLLWRPKTIFYSWRLLTWFIWSFQ